MAPTSCSLTYKYIHVTHKVNIKIVVYLYSHHTYGYSDHVIPCWEFLHRVIVASWWRADLASVKTRIQLVLLHGLQTLSDLPLNGHLEFILSSAEGFLLLNLSLSVPIHLTCMVPALHSDFSPAVTLSKASLTFYVSRASAHWWMEGETCKLRRKYLEEWMG